MNDITITYKIGDEQGFVRANTAHGQQWLWKQEIKSLRVNGAIMASPAELLSLIAKMQNLTVTWRKT